MTSQFLFIVLVLTGIAPAVSPVPRKYYLTKTTGTWNNALAYCRANYDDLAIIDSAKNMLRLQSDAQGTLNNLDMWIGGYLNPDSFYWSYGNEPLGNFTWWIQGYPNNNYGNRFCGLITPSGWYNAVCTVLRPFICYDVSMNGTDGYIYYSTVMIWSDAQSFCRQNHTDLAGARDAAEYSTITGKISGETWFGLFKEPWKWVDQSEMNLPWYPTQPENYYGNEFFAYMYNFQAADLCSSFIFAFLCHRDVTGQQQVLRLKVESSLDVNNPAVSAAVLEMIQQKLKDHGIDQNITVKWRKQQDGAVFHKLDLH